jgi:putative ubiquitin-RnfH superfamily antitoxin RatB of RatAB toxin-antitoxin module
MARAEPMIPVEVAYALPAEQVILRLDVEQGATLRDAIERSGILDRFPEIDLARNKVGVFGKLSKLDAVLRPKDRVEIYRALIADPKEVRRRRAEKGVAARSKG